MLYGFSFNYEEHPVTSLNAKNKKILAF